MHDHPFLNFAWPIFWVTFAALFVFVPRLLRHRERLKAMDVVRTLAEKGAPLPAELTAALKPTARDLQEQSGDRDLRRGVILLAVAAAMTVFAIFITLQSGPSVRPVYGIAAFPGLLGLAFIAFWWFGRRDPPA